MKRLITLIIALTQAIILPLTAQTVLTMAGNQMQVGDVLTLKRLDTISPGAAGSNQVWDYSGTEVYEDFVIQYNADASKGAGFLACSENGDKQTYFQITPTQTLYSGLTTTNTQIAFPTATVEMTYPFEYGSVVSGAMTGSFTQSSFTQPVVGSYETKADAWGTLILPNGVTINNVLRVKSVRDYTHEFSGSDYHFIVNRYAFYAPGQRYPVLQIKDVVYDCINCACDGTEYKAYFNPSVTADSPSDKDKAFKYKVYPNPFERELRIDYELKEQAKVRISLLDMAGREIKVISDKTEQIGVYNVSVDMSGYRASNFVLRLLVNDILYSEKLIKKEGSGKR